MRNHFLKRRGRSHRIATLMGGVSDITRPTATITSSEASPSAVLPVPIAFTLSEAATDFAEGDLTLSGCTVASFAGSGTSYTCTATPTAPNGTFTIDIAENAFHDAAGNGNTAATQFSFTSSAFALADEFTTNRAAGAVNGTAAEPTGGNRTVTDTGSKLTIGSGTATSSGATGNNNPMLVYTSSYVRAAGKALLASLTIKASGSNEHLFGWSSTSNGTTHTHRFYQTSGTGLTYFNGSVRLVGALTGAGTYQVALVLRATGCFFFIKGGSQFTDWTLVWIDKTSSSASPMYVSWNDWVGASAASFDKIRIPTTLLTIAPLASDAFTRADGSLGNTGGGGSEEAGGSGLAWTSQAGTWGIATNKAACSALAGSVGIATVPCGTTNIMAEVVATRAGGTSGLCLRYTDANNYIKAVHNGTNLQVIEVVAGTPNTLINAAATYGAAFRMLISMNGNKVRAYYNEAAVGAEVTTAVTTGNAHGLFTDDTGATFDNFVVFAKGNGGEYTFDTYTNP
jgi:hypothetical protein